MLGKQTIVFDPKLVFADHPATVPHVGFITAVNADGTVETTTMTTTQDWLNRSEGPCRQNQLVGIVTETNLKTDGRVWCTDPSLDMEEQQELYKLALVARGIVPPPPPPAPKAKPATDEKPKPPAPKK